MFSQLYNSTSMEIQLTGLLIDILKLDPWRVGFLNCRHGKNSR